MTMRTLLKVLVFSLPIASWGYFCAAQSIIPSTGKGEVVFAAIDKNIAAMKEHDKVFEERMNFLRLRLATLDVARSNPNAEPREAILRGDDALAKADWEKAKKEFIAAKPPFSGHTSWFAVSYFWIGYCEEKNGHISSATNNYSTVIRIWSKGVPVLTKEAEAGLKRLEKLVSTKAES